MSARSDALGKQMTDDFLLGFDVEDRSDPKFAAIEQKLAHMRDSLNKQNQYWDQYEQKVEQTTQQFEKMGPTIGIVSGLMSSLATKGIAAIEQLLGRIIQFAKASIDLRAQVDTLGVSLNNIAGNSGYARDEIAKFEESVKSKGITTRQARESLIQMAQAELDLTKSAALARVAQDAAVGANITSAEAFDRITRSIITLQPEIVRNLNLNVSLQAAYEREAVALGKTAEQLTLTEKKQVAMNEILRAGTLIAGTYEAAMGSVGKQSKSTERLLEEVQMKIGGLFQPAYFEKVIRYNDLLKELNEFLDDNSDDMAKYATMIGNLFGSAVDLIRPMAVLMSDILSLLGSFVRSAQELNIAMMGIFGEDAQKYIEDIYDNWLNIAAVIETATKLLILFGAGVTYIGEQMKGVAAYFEAVLDFVSALRTGDIKVIDAARQKAYDTNIASKNNSGAIEARDAYIRDAIEAMPELIDGYNAVGDAAETASKKAEIAAMRLADALALATGKLKALKENYDEAEFERRLKEQRRVIEEELRMQWDSEDRAREHAERTKEIMQNAAEQQKQIVESYNEAKIQIEEDYRKRLQQIQKEFEEQSSELARRRDAVGLLALIRQNKKVLENEKESVEERRKKSEESYRKAVSNLDKSLQEQLKKLAEAEQKQLESYQRGLDRQKVLRDLHNKWEQEDRDRAQQKALTDVIKFYMGLDGATKEGLGNLLADWGWYFTQLNAAIEAYNGGFSGISSGGSSAGDDAIREAERKTRQDLNGDGVIGQAGQVSQMLSPTFTPAMAGIGQSRLPIAHTSQAGRSSKDIRVTVDGTALDPYMQRYVANALIEVERNAGNG